MALLPIFEFMKIRETKDGSVTLYVPELDEHYHSIHGAYSESLHVFIKEGLHSALESFDEIELLEIGFGTGLNIWLTCIESLTKDFKFHAYCIDNLPVKEDLYFQLNYPEFGNSEVERSFYDSIMRAPWNEQVDITRKFRLHKVEADWRSHELPKTFNLIYYDAFAPAKQPEMWAQELFEKVAAHTPAGAVMVTYTANGDVRRAMKHAGFAVEKRPGPAGKREMTRATRI